MGGMTTGMPPPRPLTYFTGSEPRMRFRASYTYLFGNPNKWMNLLLAAVCVLIPIVGIMVLIGWLIEVLVPRLAEEWPGWAGPANYPDFDFNRFVPYLTRGLWPFVVAFVASLVVIVPMYLLLFITVLGAAAAKSNPVLITVIVGVGVLLFLAGMEAMALVLTPLMIRAALVQ